MKIIDQHYMSTPYSSLEEATEELGLGRPTATTPAAARYRIAVPEALREPHGDGLCVLEVRDDGTARVHFPDDDGVLTYGASIRNAKALFDGEPSELLELRVYLRSVLEPLDVPLLDDPSGYPRPEHLYVVADDRDTPPRRDPVHSAVTGDRLPNTVVVG